MRAMIRTLIVACALSVAGSVTHSPAVPPATLPRQGGGRHAQDIRRDRAAAEVAQLRQRRSEGEHRRLLAIGLIWRVPLGELRLIAVILRLLRQHSTPSAVDCASNAE